MSWAQGQEILRLLADILEELKSLNSEITEIRVRV